MRHTRFCLSLIILLALSLPGLHAQQRQQGFRPIATTIDVNLKLKQHVMQGNQVLIQYSIPYDGMVELRLFDNATQKLVYRTQYIQHNGDNEIRLRSDRIPAGSYTYRLSYKGRDTQNTFSLSGPNAAPPRQQPRPAQRPAENNEPEPEPVSNPDDGW